MKQVEFCHKFDPGGLGGAVSVNVPRTGGAFPSRLTIIGEGADKLSEAYHQNMSGWDCYPRMVTSTVCEITRSRDTSWDKALPMLKRLAEQHGFVFEEKYPS